MKEDKFQNLVDSKGKILKFSEEGFRNLVVNYPNHCFVCGAESIQSSPNNVNSVVFNGEHVVPNWLINHFGLNAKKVTMFLPSGQEMTYGKKMPCCQECNSHFGLFFEEPISEAVKSGGINKWLKVEDHQFKFHAWLSFVFFKIHLFERDFYDLRSKNEVCPSKLGDGYEYGQLFDMHTLMRAAVFGNRFESTPGRARRHAFGSQYIFDVQDNGVDFDFCSSLTYKTFYLRFNNTCIVSTFDDSGFSETIGKALLSSLAKTVPSNNALYKRIKHPRWIFNFFCAIRSTVSFDKPLYTHRFSKGKSDTHVGMVEMMKIAPLNLKNFQDEAYIGETIRFAENLWTFYPNPSVDE